MRWLRGLKAGSRLIAGFLIHYNHVRPHGGLDDITPGEAAGITVSGRE